MFKPTPLSFDNKARESILKGINKIYDAVRMSIGPQGGNALIFGIYSRPYRITNDGVTIAEVIELKDPHEKLAAKAFVDAAKQTNLKAGDGTSATTVIAGKLLNDIMPLISQTSDTEGFDVFKKGNKKRGVMDIKKELFDTRNTVIEKIKERSQKVESLETLKKIATISVENEKLGDTIATMAWDVGTDGFIDIVEGFKGGIETEIIKGSRFPAKVPAKVFVNNIARYEMVSEDVHVLLTNYVIDKQTMSLLLKNLQGTPKLAIIAPDFKESALITMANINNKNGELLYAPVKAPSLRTEQFIDIEVFSGARFVNKDRGDKPENVTKADLGFFTKLVVKDNETREDAVALGGKGFQNREINVSGDKMPVLNAVEQRIGELKGQVEETRIESQKNLLKRRIAGISSAVGVIRVSYETDAETYYWKKKIEDAVYACKAALEEGYVRGGGLCLKEIAEELPEDNLLRPALIAPYDQIQENAQGLEIAPDIFDPTKAIRCAVFHAVSVAANLATVKVIIPEEQERTPAEGYKDIADAISLYAHYWAREKGIIKENELEIAKDNMQRHDEILRNTID